MRGAAHLAVVVVVLLTAVAGAHASRPVVPTPIGPGALYHPEARGPLFAAGRAIAGLACSLATERRAGAHLELFARGLVVLVPAGIGIAPPLRAAGPIKVVGGCSYPARTREPTGVIEAASGSRITVGDFFAIWGQPLGPRRLAGFRAVGVERVRAWVDGRAWPGDPRSIPLLRHSGDRARARALRPTSRELPVRERTLTCVASRATRCACAAGDRRGGGGLSDGLWRLLVGPVDADGRCCEDVRARGLPAGRRSRGRPPDNALVQDHATLGEAADGVSQGRRPARRRARDRRPRRPLEHHSRRIHPSRRTARSRRRSRSPRRVATASSPTPIPRRGRSRTSSSFAGSPSEAPRSPLRLSGRPAPSSWTAIASRSRAAGT